MIHLVLTSYLWLVPQTALTDGEPTPADIEAVHMIERHRAEVLCVTRRRPESETVEACTDRRLALIHPVSPTYARAARIRCESGDLADGETLAACMARGNREVGMMVNDIFGSGIRTAIDLDPPAAATEPPTPLPRPTPACARETVQAADGTTSWAVMCGNDAALARQIRDQLRPER